MIAEPDRSRAVVALAAGRAVLLAGRTLGPWLVTRLAPGLTVLAVLRLALGFALTGFAFRTLFGIRPLTRRPLGTRRAGSRRLGLRFHRLLALGSTLLAMLATRTA